MRRTFVVGLALVLGLYAAAEEKKAEALDPAIAGRLSEVRSLDEWVPGGRPAGVPA